jgi:hypothetical protein
LRKFVLRKFALRKFALRDRAPGTFASIQFVRMKFEFGKSALVKSTLMKSALTIFLSALFLSAPFAHAQQFDVAVGGGTLFSTKNTSASLAFLPPAEKGGLYPNVSIERTYNNHFGYSAELAFRYKQNLYNGYQPYRPILYDFNAMYVPRLTGVVPTRFIKKTRVDFTGGVGGESLIFYTQYGNCNFTGCAASVNSNHFLVHAGAEVRYMLWHRLFIRPEANLYHIFDNSEFHSDNVLRLGASVGFTFHRE